MSYLNKSFKAFLTTLSLLIVFGGYAQTITVTNLNDDGAGSLRQAVASSTGTETIVFDPSLAGGTIVLTTGEIAPTVDVIIDGQNNDITINANGTSRSFYANGVNLTISHLTMINGSASIGGAIYIENGGNLLLDYCFFRNNNGWNDGGAIRSLGGNHTLTNCEFIGNDAGALAGAYYKLFGSAYFENCLFAGNYASGGGALFLRGGTDYMIGCTVTSNRVSGQGAALLFDNGNLTIRNSLFWMNEHGGTIGDLNSFYEVLANGVTINVQQSLIHGSGGSLSWDPSFGNDLGGNMADIDPLFVDPQPTTSAPTVAGSYQLELGSPVQDQGLNTLSTQSFDLLGNTRIVYSGIDLGCYELCKTISTISQSVCSSYTSPSGNYTWTTSGLYLDTLSNYLGCDSVITINLTVNNTFNTISPTVCDQYIMPGGSIQNTSGVYMDTIPNAASCDSIITVNLTILNSTTNTISPVVCESYTVPSGDETYFVSGVYSDTIPNSIGCDSIITINLIVNNNSVSTINPVVCETYTVPSGDETYTVSGVYNDTIPNAFGCDSVITVVLTVNYNSTSTISPTVCDSYVVPSGDETYTVSGVYSDTIPNYTGCDSVITIDLTVNYQTTSILNPSVCYTYTTPGGTVLTSSGTYNDTIPNAAGCDSVITINLTVNAETYNTISDAACYSYPSPSGLYNYTSSGTYYDTIPNAAGCDSIITLNLIINQETYATLNQVECYTYTSPSGLIWNTSGTYNDTIPNATGCDSVITINLTINSTYNSFSDVACFYYTSPSGKTWVLSGVYQDTITNAAGCDSIMTIDLTVNNVDVSTTVLDEGQTLQANQSSGAYQWLDCDDGMLPLSGETSQSLAPPNTGNYAVEVTANGCTDTSACQYMEIWEVEATAFTPNGDGVNEVLVLKLEDPVNTVKIFNRWGDEIASFENYDDVNVVWDGSDQNGDVVSGTYYFIIETTARKYSGWIQLIK